MKIMDYFVQIGSEVFQISLPIYLLLALSEYIFAGSVTGYFNLTYLLVVIAVSGFFAQFEKNERSGERHPSADKVLQWLLQISIILLSAVMLYFTTQELGFMSYIITILGTLIIALVSRIILEESYY